MPLSSTIKPERIQKHARRIAKAVRRGFSGATETRPVFVLGRQRSGTTMMMIVFELHADTEIFDEARNSVAFEGYALRELPIIDELIRKSRAPVACFKPLCDSHRLGELLERYPSGKCLWMYRHFGDVAHSIVAKFPDADAPVRAVAEGKPGGEGFRRELSSDSLAELRSLYRPDLSDLDVAALSWLTRNRCLIDSGLASHPRLYIQQYEAMVTDPQSEIRKLLRFCGLRESEHVVNYVHARSVRQKGIEGMDGGVRAACEALLVQLDRARGENNALARF